MNNNKCSKKARKRELLTPGKLKVAQKVKVVVADYVLEL